MNVAIIISTHGSTAQELLITTEMLIGKQENIDFINFYSNDNLEILMNKYNKKLKTLDISQGILFMVDMWGGSPFNAASQIMNNKNQYDIITGINIPMLVNVLLTRIDKHTLNELVNIAIKTGRSEIKALNFKNKNNIIKNQLISNGQTQNNNNNLKKHMFIVLARIDDRLIHGQIVTSWTKETNIKRIIVVNDEVAIDKMRSTLLKQVAPPGITAHVINIDKCIRVYNNPKYASERVMLLFTNPQDVVRIIEGGVEIKSVNIGGMAYYNGKIKINNTISIDHEDIKAFYKLSKLGIELEVRKVSNETKIDMLSLIKKQNINVF